MRHVTWLRVTCAFPTAFSVCVTFVRAVCACRADACGVCACVVCVRGVCSRAGGSAACDGSQG
eukprot:6205086-Pleurochrysis_carterae.AAC.1